MTNVVETIEKTHQVGRTKTYVGVSYFECERCMYCFMAEVDSHGSPFMSTKQLINPGNTAVNHVYSEVSDEPVTVEVALIEPPKDTDDLEYA